jgi:N-acetylated-alpha-linked acidic dipeptidase
LHKLADGMRVKTRELSKMLDGDDYKLVADPKQPRTPPPRDAEVPYLNFAELDNAVANLERSAKAFDAEYARLAAGEAAGADAACGAAQCNADLTRTNPDGFRKGLPGREWYQTYAVCTGFPYRLWREDAAGHSRGNRRAPLG